MKKFLMPVLASLFVVAALGSMSGCEKKGPMEKAGESIDEAVEEVGDKVEDATDGN